MAEGTGKPDKISLDEILSGGSRTGGPGDEDGVIEVIAQDEPTVDRGPVASGEAEPAETRPSPSEEDPGAAQVEELLREALAEKEQLNDMYLRARADLENFRRRVERERDDERIRAGAAVIAEILPALDNLDRALSQPPETAGLREGVLLIRRQLEEALRKQGLEPIEALGETFDPARHEALAAEPREGFAPNTVVEEVRKGYIFAGRVLRPSLVKVVVAPHSAPRGKGEAGGGADGTDHRD